MRHSPQAQPTARATRTHTPQSMHAVAQRRAVLRRLGIPGERRSAVHPGRRLTVFTLATRAGWRAARSENKREHMAENNHGHTIGVSVMQACSPRRREGASFRFPPLISSHATSLDPRWSPCLLARGFGDRRPRSRSRSSCGSRPPPQCRWQPQSCLPAM